MELSIIKNIITQVEKKEVMSEELKFNVKRLKQEISAYECAHGYLVDVCQLGVEHYANVVLESMN